MAMARSAPAAAPSSRPAGRHKAVVVYANDFEKQAGAEWSQRQTELTPNGRRRFLGRFGRGAVRLPLKDLPPHERLRVSFDLLVFDSWDGKDWGRPGAGPDIWSLEVEGKGRLLRCTFANQPMAFDNRQTFPDPYPGPLHPPQTGAAEKNSLPKRPGRTDYGSAVYRLSFTFAHRDEDVTFVFSGTCQEPLGDESWGLDNVKVDLPAAAPRLDARRLDAHWEGLHEPDRVRAFGAYCALMAAGEQAAALAEERLRPKPMDPAAARRQIAALDAQKWSQREKATAELQRMGPGVVPLLREALEGNVSTEVAARIQQVLKELTAKELSGEELARHQRIVRLLAISPCPRAVEALGHLRRSAPDAKVRHLAGAAAARAARPLIDDLLRRAEAQARALAFPAAQAACREARDLAKAAASPAEGRIAARLSRLDQLAGAHKELLRMADHVQAAPDDRALRRRIIRTAVVTLDSPAAAEPYLDKHSDPAWRRHVPLARRDPADLSEAELLGLAKWYRSLAGEADKLGRPAMLRRAREYLELHVRGPEGTLGEARAAVAEVEEALAREPAAHWIDLLAQLHPALHRVSGQWTLSGGTLRVAAAEFARLALPVAPRGDYELTADFVRRAGEGDVNFVLPIGATGVLCSLDDNHNNSGFQHVNGRDLPKPNPPHDLTNGKTYRFAATVRRRGDDAEIVIRLDGKEYMRWRGPIAALSVRGSWTVSDSGAPGLGAHESAVEFSRIRLRMLTARAELVPVSIDPPLKPARRPPGPVHRL